MQAGEYLYGRTAMQARKAKIFRNVIECDKYRLNLEMRTKIRKDLNINDDCMVIGHTARFSEVKNHKFDVEILKEIIYLTTKSRIKSRII